MPRFTFRKAEHICLKSEIENLFSAGSTSMSAFPLRATYRKQTYAGQGPHVKVLLSVSKRHLHHAVDRNRAKRQIREAYRLQKHLLTEAIPADMAINVAFIWLADHPMSSKLVSARMNQILQRIRQNVVAEVEQTSISQTNVSATVDTVTDSPSSLC